MREWFAALPATAKILVGFLAAGTFVVVAVLLSVVLYILLGVLGILGEEPTEWKYYVVLAGVVAGLLLGGVALRLLATVGPVAEAWERFKVSRAARLASVEEFSATLQRERESGIEVGISPSVVLDQASERMARAGWTLQTRTETSAIFARDKGASCLVAGCLAVFLIVPAIIYLFLYNTTSRVAVMAYPHEGGSRLVFGGDDEETLLDMRRWAHELTTEQREFLAVEEHPESSTPAASTLVDKLRELGELRDAGLITPEEFEEKKRDLLDRL